MPFFELKAPKAATKGTFMITYCVYQVIRGTPRQFVDYQTHTLDNRSTPHSVPGGTPIYEGWGSWSQILKQKHLRGTKILFCGRGL